MANRCTRIPEIMMPREGTDLSKWAVIACDQYTSQPEYWAETDRIVGDAPSTLRLSLRSISRTQTSRPISSASTRPCSSTCRTARCVPCLPARY